ncbi:MAG: radical SAM protein [Desulfobacterales bacterium]|nr:MAG: radical SAM protein [Desulfobacterales bacterium]
MAGMANGRYVKPERSNLIPLPEGSELFSLPDRLPVGTDPDNGEPLLLDKDPNNPNNRISAVAAFMAPAYTAIYNTAYQTQENPVLLPLFAYTAVGWHDGRFWVSGFRSDPDIRQDYGYFNQSKINRKTRKKLRKFPTNKLIQHLGTCCLIYHCPAARNFFLDRWEAPLPTSPVCNARCVGCISLQPSGCCPSTQNRIQFVPSVREIAEIAIPHLNNADYPIVSYGQGCEGEPLMQGELLEQSILFIRKKTAKGVINLNSNASRPEVVDRLASAGLDSIRVSMNSAQKQYYHRYYRPTHYTFADVESSIKTMKAHGKFVSLNYFILPGFSDSIPETDALCTLVERSKPDFIQLRNLNMDPEWYLRTLKLPKTEKALGIRKWLALLKKRFPALKFGYFNPFLQQNKPVPIL